MSSSLSIVVPAYNEANRLGRSLHRAFSYLNVQPYASELIVVDDGSKDNTSEVAKELFNDAGKVQVRLIRYSPNRGKGFAVKTGLLATTSPIAIFSDSDFSSPITEVPKIVDPILSGAYDVAFGSRALDRSLIGVHQSWRREQGGKLFNLLVRWGTGLPFWDTQCGFKAFRMSTCQPIISASRIERFGFDVELLYLAHLAELRILEVPVRWDHDAQTQFNVSKDSQRMMRDIRTIRRNAQRGHYDKALAEARISRERITLFESPH